MVRMAAIGDNTIDTYLDQGLQFPGGNAVNVAAFAARLGAQSAYIGCVGDDDAGQLILQSLQAEQVDISHCQINPGATAWACVTHENHDRVFLGSDSGVCKQLQLGQPALDYLSHFDLIHSSTYSGLESQLPQLHALGNCLSFDFSDDWTPRQLASLAPQIDIAFLSMASQSESQCRALLHYLAQLDIKVAVLTRGSQGALALAGGELVSQAVTPVNTVDTLGAGDGFIAAFLMAWLQTRPLAQSMQFAADFAAKVCTTAGGFGHATPARPETLSHIRHALNLA